jgi:hypothetical protein
MRPVVASTLAGVLVVVGSTLAPSRAHAGATLDLGEDAKLDFGFMLQTHTVLADEDLAGDGERDAMPRLIVRRARLRLGAQATRYFSAVLQTDRGDGDGRLGLEYRLIDAHATFHAHPWFRVISGIHMAPANRQNLTLSSALVGFDRPSASFKTLTWGTRALAQFGNRSMPNTDAGLRAPTPVRDLGWTAFGAGDLSPKVHLKYYAGIYEGVQLTATRTFRTTARVQLNLLDAEPDYFNASTYRGARRTIALGAAFDMQPNVAEDRDAGPVDYRYATLDVFAEHRVGPGSLSFEAAYSQLSLGGGRAVATGRETDAPTRDVRAAEGGGVYVQSAYTLRFVQPWVGYERWRARDERGSFEAARFGFNHYVRGQNLNVKVAYEHMRGGAPLGRGAERTWGTFAVGLFLFY